MLKSEMIVPPHVELKTRAFPPFLPVTKKKTMKTYSSIDMYLFRGLFLSLESWHLHTATWQND